MTDIITLAAGDWLAEVAPAIGGALLSLSFKGEDLLRPTSAEAVEAGDVRLTAAYPMIPYANRIDHGRFSFDGRAWQLERSNTASHSLHGVGWRRAWAVQAKHAQACTLSLLHRPDIDGVQDWPFAFEARQRFVLSAQGLTLTLAVTNLEQAPAPAGIGWHPFFRRRHGETLAFQAKAAWRNGPDLLPSGVETDANWNHALGQALNQRVWDNDFSGWGGLASLDAPSGLPIRLRAGSVFGALRLYTPAGQDFYAVEPVSHLANAINRPKLEDHAMTLLAPGASLHGDIEIGLETKS